MRTIEKIIKVLKEQADLDAIAISKKTKLTYDTTARYLKRMAEKGLIGRDARGKRTYYYHIANNY